MIKNDAGYIERSSKRPDVLVTATMIGIGGDGNGEWVVQVYNGDHRAISAFYSGGRDTIVRLCDTLFPLFGGV